jgi:hypothetical protein
MVDGVKLPCVGAGLNRFHEMNIDHLGKDARDFLPRNLLLSNKGEAGLSSGLQRDLGVLESI